MYKLDNMAIIRVPELREDNVQILDRGQEIYIPAWLFLFLCLVVVAARVWSRTRTEGGLGADDYTIMAALVSMAEDHA